MVLPLFFVLDDEGEKHVGKPDADGLPFVDLAPVLLLIQEESHVPHPEYSVNVEAFVLDNSEALVVVPLALLPQHHLQLLLPYLNLLLPGSLAFECFLEFEGEILAIDDHHLTLIVADGLCIKVEQFIDKGVLGLLLLPPVSLPPQFLLDQPDEEPVELLFTWFFKHFALEGHIELPQEGTVVGDDVDRAIDGLFVVFQSLPD